MRLGIISDTHDQLARTVVAVQMLQDEGAEALIHCGDVTGPAIVAVCGALPGYYVLGNNDCDDEPALAQAIRDVGGVSLGWAGVVVLADRRIAVTHGHLHKEVRRLLEGRPDFLLTGHSHVADDRREGPTRRINPGALHSAGEYSVALLDLETGALRFLTVPR